MSTRKILLSALAMSALIAVPNLANATTGDSPGLVGNTNTSPLWADKGSYHACNVANITTSAQSITSTLVNASGTIIAGPSTVTVNPGSSTELIGPNTGVGFARCRFNGVDPANYRANLVVFRLLSSYYAVLGVSEAK